MPPTTRRPLSPVIATGTALAAALLLWAVWLMRCAQIVIAHADRVPRRNTWLYDWNVYHAAAIDLLERALYRVPLIEPGHALPIDFFNYPPLAAAWAVPLLPFGREPGGIAWLLIGIAATSVGALLGARAIGLPWKWAAFLAGAALAVYAHWPPVEAGILLGNNSHLVFGLVAGFALAHMRGHQRVAGVLLGLAIGTKLWPLALVVLLLRERRWPELRWAAGVLLVQAALVVAWLGPDVAGPMIDAIAGGNLGRSEPAIEHVIWTGWARVALDWWPDWGAYAVAAALLLVPAVGRLGLGLGIVAGLSLNLYLWHHYAPALVLGVLLTAAGVFARLRHDQARGEPDPDVTGNLPRCALD